MSSWIREQLPGSTTGFLVTDVDFLLVNRPSKTFQFLEVKQHGREIPKWQREVFDTVSDFMAAGVMNSASTWTFLGWHLLTFERSGFKDGRAWLNGQLVTEAEVRTWLSMP